MAEHEQYFEYLKQRSWRALLYRGFYLYPRLCYHLKGLTLDVGCGIGDMLRFRRNTIGADINPYLVAYCQKKGLDARLIKNGRLPFENGTFQSVILDNVLEHVASPDDLINELHRVIERGGRLVIGVPGVKGYRRDADHKIYYDEKKLTDTIQGNGFIKSALFYTPIKSNWMNHHLSFYCLFGVFLKL